MVDQNDTQPPVTEQNEIHILVNERENLVLIKFGKPIEYLTMRPEHAKMFAQVLWQHAAQLDKITLDKLDPQVIEDAKVVPLFAKKKEPPS